MYTSIITEIYLALDLFWSRVDILSGVSCTKHGSADFKESSLFSHVRHSSLVVTTVNRPGVRENCVILAIFVKERNFTFLCAVQN